MPILECESLTKLVEISKQFSSSDGWIFRGQGNINWPIKPKAGRPEYFLKESLQSQQKCQVSSDIERFEIWQQKARESKFDHHLYEDFYECLSLAQHHGLATRLLDWTSEAEVALFFAVEAETEKTSDGVVICFNLVWELNNENRPDPLDPALGSKILKIKPKEFHPRIFAQHGLFTYHFNPVVELNKEHVVQIRIPSSSKLKILEDLAGRDKTHSKLFPCLDNISEGVNFQTKSLVQQMWQEEKNLFSNKKTGWPKPSG